MDCCDKISVIIPVYNTEQYIERCLKAVLSNSYRNIEVICINDGSTDGSLNVLTSFAEKDARVKIINQENSGVSSARNAGLEVMTGDFVTFIDSDDWIHPMYFETLLYFIKLANASSAACLWQCTTDDIPRFPSFDKEKIKFYVLNKEGILKNNVAKRIVCGHLYSAELIHQHYFETELKNEEDIFFNISLALNNPYMTVAVIDQELYFYYKRLSSSSHTTDWMTKMRLSNKYLDCFENSTIEETRGGYLREACKAVLAFRYAQMFSAEYTTIKTKCAKLIKRCKRNMCGFRGIRFNEKIMYHVFFDFPCIYRLFRIADDRTLLECERRQKKLAKKRESPRCFRIDS